MSIADKLRIAARAARYVQKDGHNAFHRYKFASAANVLGHVNAALDAAGLAVTDTDVVILSEIGAGKDKVVTAKVCVTIRDGESGETATFRGIGSGMDSGDKAVMKATTAAQKYAWIVGLSIETGDDPEADEETDRRVAAPPPKPAQKQSSKRAPAPEADPERDAIQAEASPLAVVLAAIERVELPGEAVTVWMQHRVAVAELPPAERATAWEALCARTEDVGKMKNAKVWLRKAIAEETARRASEVTP